MSGVKKVLTILLAVLFVVSFTVAASSAEPYHDREHWGHHDHDDDDYWHHHHHDDDCWAWNPNNQEWEWIC
jgi:hypothetical protein